MRSIHGEQLVAGQEDILEGQLWAMALIAKLQEYLSWLRVLQSSPMFRDVDVAMHARNVNEMLLDLSQGMLLETCPCRQVGGCPKCHGTHAASLKGYRGEGKPPAKGRSGTAPAPPGPPGTNGASAG